MARKKLEDYTTQELEKNEKGLRVVLFVLLSMLLIYAGLMVYLMATNKFDTGSPLIVMPLALFAVFASVNAARGGLAKELKRRKQ